MLLMKYRTIWVAAALGCLYLTIPVLGEVPSVGNNEPGSRDIEWEFEDESTLLDPLNASDDMVLEDGVPEELTGIDDVTHIYRDGNETARKENKVIDHKLIKYADEAMEYVESVYSQIQRYNNMYAGKGAELTTTMDQYTLMLSRMLEDKRGLKHLSFLRRYLLHATKIKDSVMNTYEMRNNVMKEANKVYNGIKEKYKTIKLDFERYYSRPEVVINNAVSSLVNIGESYKVLVKVHKKMVDATKAFRVELNRMRASTVYMFSYLLCLDVLYTEIMPLRMVAVQDVMGTKDTGDMMESYLTNIMNKRKAVKALLRSPILEEKVYHQIDRIFAEMSSLYERAKKISKKTSALVERINKHGIVLLNRRITRVVDAWNEHYRRPILMGTKLNNEYIKLEAMAAKIKDDQNIVHTIKQSMYTMSTRCNELYARARELAGLGADGVAPRDQGGVAESGTASVDNGNNMVPGPPSFGHDIYRGIPGYPNRPMPSAPFGPWSPSSSDGKSEPAGNNGYGKSTGNNGYGGTAGSDFDSVAPKTGKSSRGSKRKHDRSESEYGPSPARMSRKSPMGISIPRFSYSGTSNTGDGSSFNVIPSDGTVSETKQTEDDTSTGDEDDSTSVAYDDERGSDDLWYPSGGEGGGSRGKTSVDESTEVPWTTNKRLQGSVENKVAIDLLDLLKRAIDVRRRLEYYKQIITVLRSESANIPGARESRFIIDEINRMYHIFGQRRSNSLETS
ncbi:hypothetical protein BaOVIS_031290 [Babesia ovis]|uniref:Uncharacterized protein n=1 Tax=Babesia ovis TaxID=5869 RepID=A0A9W5WW44_BABOV|nr:hypothetical protein BaOVIS_031290 [Babesia ovis]